MSSLAELRNQPDLREPVLVVDFDTLACIEGEMTNVSQWGCSIISPDASALHKTIGIRLGAEKQLIKARVTAVRGQNAMVVFPRQHAGGHEKRRERRNPVNIPVVLKDNKTGAEISGTIVDAGRNGCRVVGEGLMSLPDEVILEMVKFGKPMVGEFAWRNEGAAGLRLLWNVADHKHEAAKI